MRFALLLIAVVFLIRFVVGEIRCRQPRHRGDATYFPVGFRVRLLTRVAPIFWIVLGHNMTQEATETSEVVMAGLFVCAGIFSTFCEPNEIAMTPEGVFQRKRLGLKTIHIPWETAAARLTQAYSARYEGLVWESSDDLRVVDRKGNSILHTRYHSGRIQFVTQLQRHQVFTQGL